MHVLLLEDDLDFAQLLKSTLQDEGMRVTHVSSAKEGIEQLGIASFDLVITDLFVQKDGRFLPDGGITLISQVRHVRDLDVPVIAISGSFSGSSGDRARTSSVTVGANYTLAKPFRHAELVEAIASVTSGKARTGTVPSTE